MGPAELFSQVSGLALPEAAARFASVGVPVFPCVPGGKRPLVEHGFHDATAEGRQVGLWWRQWRTANIGVPTGAASGVEVVDVDRKAAGSGFAAFERARRAGLAGGWLALVRTPSGGMHAYYPADPDRPQPSWQAARAHVDFRGEGGYVVVPPSMVEVADDRRTRYAVIGGPQPSPVPVDAGALRNLFDPRPEPIPRPRGAVASADAEQLAAWVAARGEGERNRGLFWAACRLAEAGLSPVETQAVLAPAAEQAGLPPREVLVTIRSAYRATGTAGTGAPVSPGGHDETPRRAARFDGQVLA
ncbi:bifunctional DNA primase/polymerase [Amycolatopsis sacchari]|uniref:bifunctional DNA primase/polymerase n=1 Tax=Amycolatopsis sacchari TaxID=115433 RepID=UPI003EBDCFB6